MKEANKIQDLNTPNSASRRTFLKIMAGIGIGAVAVGLGRGALQNIIPASVGVSGYPTLTLYKGTTGTPLQITDLSVNNPAAVIFSYPLQNEPNFILRLGDSSNNDVSLKPYTVQIPATGGSYTAPGGVGPYGSVIAYSAVCQHLGGTPPSIHYYAPGSTIPSHPGHSGANNTGFINCILHGSTYDPFKGCSVVTDPTKSPLPSVVLTYDATKQTFSVSSLVGPTIQGHTNNLTGGSPLPSSSSTEVTTIAV